MRHFIKAGVFKAQCLKIMDEVKRTKQSVIITKRKEAIARLGPVTEEKTSIFGKMKGTIIIKGDIIEPTGEVWNADT